LNLFNNMQKKKLILLLYVLIVCTVLILVNFYTIKVLSGVRSYIGGESGYSKGQKDASLYLSTYVHTGNEAYFQSFKAAIDLPKGDNLARANLVADGPDKITEGGFLRGNNHLADIPDMIWLFKTFNTVPFMNRAISIWANAEPLINELDAIGEDLHTRIAANSLGDAARLEAVKKISTLSSELSGRESAFSQVLGDAARQIKEYLQYANVFFILLLLGIIAFYAINMVNSLSSFEKALNNKIHELNETNKELGNFTHVASHDLQEPLRMVSGFLSLLEKKYDADLDATARSYIRFAVDGASRMRALITDLLEYSQTHALISDYSPVNLDLVCKEMKLIFWEGFAGGKLNFENLPEIRANKVQMRQLFQNLIGNAIKYRGELPPEVLISATENESHHIFSVSDNGQGIDARYFEKVFIIFQRLHNNSAQAGTGIGLAICKKIVERHGGKIWIESQIGKGSTFFFSIAKKPELLPR
jgi:signal transduction histidine kinase